jgi:hypothetical protein
LRRIRAWLDRQPPPRRRLYVALLAISLATLPCYATGLALLAVGTSPADALDRVTEEPPSPTPTAGPVLRTRVPEVVPPTQEPTAGPTVDVATPFEPTATATATEIVEDTPTVEPTETSTSTPTVELPSETPTEAPTDEIPSPTTTPIDTFATDTPEPGT